VSGIEVVFGRQRSHHSVSGTATFLAAAPALLLKKPDRGIDVMTAMLAAQPNAHFNSRILVLWS